MGKPLSASKLAAGSAPQEAAAKGADGLTEAELRELARAGARGLLDTIRNEDAEAAAAASKAPVIEQECPCLGGMTKEQKAKFIRAAVANVFAMIHGPEAATTEEVAHDKTDQAETL